MGDVLTTSEGGDSLVGGTGADTFYYSSFDDVMDGCDRADFISGTDVILLGATSFGALASGGYIDAPKFEVVSGFDGSKGSIAEACVVFGDVSTILFYGANGSSVADGETDFMEVTTINDVLASDIQIA